MGSQTEEMNELHWIKGEVEKAERMVKELNQQVGKINRIVGQMKLIIEGYGK